MVKNTNHYKTKIIVLFIIMIGFVSACGKPDISYNPSALNIFHPGGEYGWKWLDDVKAQFEEENPGIDINIIRFNDPLTYNTKLIAELYAGKGPDVIIMNNINIDDLIKNGVLYDLTEVIPDNFDFEEIGGDIQNRAIVDGKRYYAIVGYYRPLFYSTDSILNENGITSNRIESWEDFIAIVNAYKAKGKYLFGGENIGTEDGDAIDDFFIYMLNSYGIEFFDYENNESLFEKNSEVIVKMMEQYKNEILPVICPKNVLDSYNNYYEAMKAGVISLIFSDKLTFQEVYMENSFLAHYMDGEMKLIKLPSRSKLNNNYIQCCVGINQSSRCKKEAFSYMMTFITGDIEGRDTLIPVSRSLRNKQIELFCFDENDGVKRGIGYGNVNIKAKPLPLHLAKELGQQSIKDRYILKNNKVYSIINIKMKDFLNHQKTAKQTLTEIHNTINRILKE